MCSENSEGAHQQESHEPEGVKEYRIFIAVMVSCVGQIACKPSMGSSVALSTCFNNVLPRQTRSGFPDREYIVGSMAIITFGRGSVAKLRNFAVECLEICVSDLRMTSPALIDDIELEPFLVGSADCMRGMAIVAHR